jgi:MFS family permease
MCARFGAAVAPFITGRLADALGWRGAFWALGAAGVVWSVIFLAWFRDRPEDVPSCNDAERERIRTGRASHERIEVDEPTQREQIRALSTSKQVPRGADDDATPSDRSTAAAPTDAIPVPKHVWPPLGLILKNVSALGACSAAFFVCFSFSFFITTQQTYYKDVFNLSAEDSEVLTGLPMVCGALGALVGGWLSDELIRRTGSRKWGRSLVGIGGFAGAGVCVLAASTAAGPVQAATLLCLGMFASDLAIPTIWATLADIGGPYVGTLSGLANMVGNIGGAISPVLIPIVLGRLDHLPPVARWQYVLAGLAIVWFLAAASWLFIDAGKPLVDQPAETPI